MFWTGFTSLSVLLLFFYQSRSLSSCAVFDFILSNIDNVLSINPSANVFIFGDFNVCHKDWLTYSGGTNRPGEPFYNFPISNNLTQIVNFPKTHAILDFFLSSVSNCSTMACPPLGNPDHVVVSVSVDLLSKLTM